MSDTLLRIARRFISRIKQRGGFFKKLLLPFRELVFVEIMTPTQFSLRTRTAENLQHELRLKLGGESSSFGHQITPFSEIVLYHNLVLGSGLKNRGQYKLLYLRDEFTIPDELLPRSGDIIISNASGSLKHLGKVVWVDENLNSHVVGGFLGIFRFSDSELAKAVFYRLLSEKFRAFVAGLKGQNINNLDIDKIDDFGLTVPRDLNKFVKDALRREKELEQINETLTQIKN